MKGVLPQAYALLPAQPVFVSKSVSWGFSLQWLLR